MTVDRLPGFGRQSVKPLLFADDPERSRAAMTSDRAAFADQLRKLWHHFLAPEYVHAGDLEDAVRQPRQGHVIRPFAQERPTSRAAGGPTTADLSGRHKFKVRDWLLANIPATYSQELDTNIRERIRASISESSWTRYDAAWSCLMDFFAAKGDSCHLPLAHPVILEFLAWADVTKSLAPPTLRSYVSCISRIQTLLGYEGIRLRSEPLAEAFLKGAEAKPRLSRRPRAVRRAVSLPLLKILCHTVPDLQLDLHEKLLLRAVFTISFFGTMRIGELLGKPENCSDPNKKLRWSDAKNLGGATLLHLKSAKVVHKGGDYIYLFPVQDPVICPVKALDRLRESAAGLGLVKENCEIFADHWGEPWKRHVFDSCLDKLVKKTGLMHRGETVTGHSFRAGIPSALGALGSAEATHALKEWGRWRSPAFEAYTKRDLSAKFHIFVHILQSLHI